MASKNGTDGRIYGGDAMLIHIKDGRRRDFGEELAAVLDTQMRELALRRGMKTKEEVNSQNLCPGCYMIAAFNMLVTLAHQNGQSMHELGASMAQLFIRLQWDEALARGTEEMDIVDDNDNEIGWQHGTWVEVKT